LLVRARELGAIVCERSTVTALKRPGSGTTNWIITASDNSIEARVLLAADGRNSTVARLCHLHPRLIKERVALQTHLPMPREFGNRVVLQLLPEGYSGQAPVGEDELNLCLVSAPDKITALRSWAKKRFNIPNAHLWRTVTPLTRAPIEAAHRSLFFAGDAARVVEPFTGEGIYYAMASGALVADAIVSQRNGESEEQVAARYSAAHARLYSSRLWINRLARAAVLSPRIASAALEVLRVQPTLLRFLTSRIVNPDPRFR
jgi:flavin-dependent dehydrogenase